MQSALRNPLRSALALATVASLAALGGCARCTGALKGRQAEEFIGADPSVVVSVPALGALADGAQGLLTTARGGPGGDRLVAMSANLARQLGFDPLTRDGLKQAGLDPDRSLAIAAGGGARRVAYAALPYADLGKLEATLERLAKDRTGAIVKEERKVGDVKVTALVPSAGAPAELAYTTKDGFLLLAAGDDAPDVAAAASLRKSEESVAKLPLYTQAKAKVGERDLYVYLPKSAAPRMQMLPDVMVFGLGVSAKELALRAYLALPPEQRALAANALVGGGDDLLQRLPKNRPAYVRGGIDWAAVAKQAEKDPNAKAGLDRLRANASEAGFDFDQEVLANLEPGFALTIGIAPSANLASAFDFDPRRANPFQNYTVLGIGRVKDEKKAAATLEKLGQLVEKFGTTVEAKDVDGAKVWTANYRHGEGLSWTLRGKELFVAGGLPEGIAQAAAQLGKDKAAVSGGEFAPRAREALFGKQGLALAIDFARISEEVDKLPTEAFGTGPGAFMARSVATGVIQPLARLRGVLAIAPVEGGLTVDLSASTP